MDGSGTFTGVSVDGSFVKVPAPQGVGKKLLHYRGRRSQWLFRSAIFWIACNSLWGVCGAVDAERSQGSSGQAVMREPESFDGEIV